MRSFNLLLTTKNKDSLKNFLHFFNTNIDKNFNVVKKNISKKKRKVVITLLKSPHVNKTAQEQFEIKFISEHLKISTTQLYKCIIFFKKVKNYIFADLNFRIKFISNEKSSKLSEKIIFNIDNFKNYFFFENNTYMINKKLKQKNKKNDKTLFNNFKNSKNMLTLIDLYGS
jgi:ribosomal protein S10